MPATHGGPAYPTSKSQRGGLTVRQHYIASILRSVRIDLDELVADGQRLDRAADTVVRLADAVRRAETAPRARAR